MASFWRMFVELKIRLKYTCRFFPPSSVRLPALALNCNDGSPAGYGCAISRCSAAC